jgi:tRNA pseudouridine38-40 synthase
MKLARYLVSLEYKGTLFHGFQKQPGLPTVQGELDSAILTYTGQEVRSLGAGRTDAGVHALGQTAAFDLDERVDIGRTFRSLNGLLPRGISIIDMREVAPDFDPRRDAVWREYRYFVLNRRAPSPLLEDLAYHFPGELDGELVKEGCALCEGEHDFSAFRAGTEEKSTARTVLECEFTESYPDLLCCKVRANSFLYKMVRIMAGALLAVGSGRMALPELSSHLEGGSGPCAEPLPGHGLYLWEVSYPD